MKGWDTLDKEERQAWRAPEETDTLGLTSGLPNYLQVLLPAGGCDSGHTHTHAGQTPCLCSPH